MTLVGLRVWGIHFWSARRFGMREHSRRASALRRIYLYWAAAGGALGFGSALSVALSSLLRPLIDTCTPSTPVGLTVTYCTATADWLATSPAAWVALVFLAIWAYHFVIVARDRAAVGESGASATLRRWYMYSLLLVALLWMLTGASGLLELGWLKAWNKALGYRYLGDAAGLFIAGLVVWGFHARAISRSHIADDRHSTLRALQGFVVVAVSIGTPLFGASQILYYALAQGLGVDHPGGAGNDFLAAAATPGSLLLVYGTAWFLVRRRLPPAATPQT